MSYLDLYTNDNNVSSVIVDRMLSLDLMGEVCLFSCGNGFRKRITAFS